MIPHIKKDRIQEELDSLYGMVVNWKKDYERLIDSAGGNDYLVSDFIGEIDEFVYPYLRRMCECGYITDEEKSRFLNKCYDEVRIFKEEMLIPVLDFTI